MKKTNANIAIIDDDVCINNMLDELLRKNGYRTACAFSGGEALALLEKFSPDLVILDLMLPDISGESLLGKIVGIPVIVLSARCDTSAKVGTLLGGAEDYMTKPFDTDELLARITLRLRKNGCSQLRYQDISLNADMRTAQVGNTSVRLTRTEYAILKLLIINAGQVVPKLTILEKISTDTPDCTEDSLKIHIHNLRKKLKTALDRDIISSVWGIGFMLK